MWRCGKSRSFAMGEGWFGDSEEGTGVRAMGLRTGRCARG